MVAIIAIGAALMMSGTPVDAGVESKRMFLMLNDQSIEFVNGAPVIGYWHTEHRWNAAERRDIDVVDGVEFVINKQFWKIVNENAARYSASSEVRIEADGRLFYRDKPVDVGLGVGRFVYVLHWHEWIVAVGTAADKTRSTIKGPISYLFWFEEKSLKGSYRQVKTVNLPPLRIYSK
jgi:hypothetical protein